MKNNYFILLLLLNLLGISLFAGKLPVIVYDRDLDFPLEGVRIQEVETGQELYTDFNGEAILEIPDDLDRAILVIELIGYETKKQLITDLISPVSIYMLMEGVLEGEELVVEVEAIGETDAEVGVSTVVEEEVIQTAAKIGFIEDAMSVVKILPGVSYSGGMASNLSIRGSDPSGLVTVMDGMVVNFPFHFGGMVSIFNPNVVESIKFSPGIFSVKHGQATSALMEVNTVTPDDGQKFSILTSSSTSEAFYQSPLGKNDEFGILGGLRLTYWEPAMRFMGWIGEATDYDELKYLTSAISIYPYIYDFYLKGFYRPSDSFYWYINGFSGNDGVGFQVPEIPGFDKNKEVLPYGEFKYNNHDLLVSTGVSFLPVENLLINYIAGYENWNIFLDNTSGQEGLQTYSDEFKALYNIEEDSAYIKIDQSDFDMEQVKNSAQTRLDMDWSITDNFLLQFGGGTTYDTYTYTSKGYMRQPMLQMDGSVNYSKVRFDTKSNDDFMLTSFGYLNLDADFSELISMELGCRADHFYQEGEIGNINTDLVPAPRVRFIITPEDNNSFFTDNSFTVGTGLFNNAPWKTGAKKPEKSFMSVIGWDTRMPLDIHFKMEGYYKYIYHRSYTNTPIAEDSGLDDITHTNGYGHIAGGDLLIERKISRFIDGMLSYTYVYGQYMEPTLEDNYTYNLNSEAPRGEYYWPSFHRFHSLNLLMDIKPTNSFKITTKFSLASGLPERDYSETVHMMPVEVDGQTVPLEFYDSKNIYSDTKRADFELPLDIKFTYHNYLPESKYNWEVYLGIENVLAPLLVNLDTSPGEQSGELSGRSEQGQGFVIPIPSIGFKLSF